MVNLGIVDDHVLFRNGITGLVLALGYQILFEASDGYECIQKLSNPPWPHLILLDINMPGMNGFETAKWITTHLPDIKILALTINNDEENIIKMLKCGADGYLLKDGETGEIKMAIQEVLQKGFYYKEKQNSSAANIIDHIQQLNKIAPTQRLNAQEQSFLKLTCAGFTLKEIAQQLVLPMQAVQELRDFISKKLMITTRVGMIIYAMQNHICD